MTRGELSPAIGFAITPNDSADLAQYTRFLSVGVAGDVKVDFVRSGTGVTLKLTQGIHQMRVKKVYATGTSATTLVGLV